MTVEKRVTTIVTIPNVARQKHTLKQFVSSDREYKMSVFDRLVYEWSGQSLCRLLRIFSGFGPFGIRTLCHLTLTTL